MHIKVEVLIVSLIQTFAAAYLYFILLCVLSYNSYNNNNNNKISNRDPGLLFTFFQF